MSAELDSAWRRVIRQADDATQEEKQAASLLKGRLLDRFLHSRAKWSGKHAVTKGKEYVKAGTAVRAARKLDGGKGKQGKKAMGPAVEVRLDGTQTPAQLHMALALLVTYSGHIEQLSSMLTIERAKQLLEAYAAMPVEGAPSRKEGWVLLGGV